MSQDEIIELAKQAGLMADGEMWFSPTYGSGDVHISHLQTFAKLVAEHEREACAVDADWCIQNHIEQHIPKRIRARKQS
jgi:hypothetical protein